MSGRPNDGVAAEPKSKQHGADTSATAGLAVAELAGSIVVTERARNPTSTSK